MKKRDTPAGIRLKCATTQNVVVLVWVGGCLKTPLTWLEQNLETDKCHHGSRKRKFCKENICGASFAQRCFRCRIEDKTPKAKTSPIKSLH